MITGRACWMTFLAVALLTCGQMNARGQGVVLQPSWAAQPMVQNPMAVTGGPMLAYPGYAVAAPGYLPAGGGVAMTSYLQEDTSEQEVPSVDDMLSEEDEYVDGYDTWYGGGHSHHHFAGQLQGLAALLAPYSEGGCCAPHWFDVHAEVAFLERDDDARYWEFVRLGHSGPTLIDSNDVAFDMDPSVRITGTWQTGAGSNLEFSWLGGNEYSNSAEVTSATDLLYSVFENFALNDLGVHEPAREIEQLHQAELQRLQFDSSFYTLELNYRRRWMGSMCLVQGSWLVGARYFELTESLAFHSEADRPDPVLPGERVGGTADFSLKARNYMTGLQVGGDTWLCIVPGLHLGLDGKLGLLGNNAKVNTVMTGTDPYNDNFVGEIGPESGGNDKGSMFFEGGVLMTYQVNHRLTLRGGYECLIVDSVALAMDNFNPTVNTGRVPFSTANATVSYQGWSFGAEWMW